MAHNCLSILQVSRYEKMNSRTPKQRKHISVEMAGNYWDLSYDVLSDAVLSSIEGVNYADNKSSHNEFLMWQKENLSTCTEHLHFDSL